MTLRLVTLIGLALVFASVNNAGAQNAPPEIVLTEIAPGSHLVEVIQPDGSKLGANLVVHRSAGGHVLLVDTSFPAPPLTAYIRQQVTSRVGSPAAVIISHWHPDHSGGIAGFSGLPVYAHSSVRLRLSQPTEGVDLAGPGTHFVSQPRSDDGLPTEVVEDSTMIQDVKIVHYPGAHTDGDIVAFMPNGVVAMGDLFWPGMFPSIDVVNGGNALGLLDALRNVRARLGPEARLVSGHGDPATPGLLDEQIEMLETSIGAIRDLVSQGMSLDAIQQENPLRKWEEWSHSLVPEALWVKLVFLSLQAHEPD